MRNIVREIKLFFAILIICLAGSFSLINLITQRFDDLLLTCNSGLKNRISSLLLLKDMKLFGETMYIAVPSDNREYSIPNKRRDSPCTPGKSM